MIYKSKNDFKQLIHPHSHHHSSIQRLQNFPAGSYHLRSRSVQQTVPMILTTGRKSVGTKITQTQSLLEMLTFNDSYKKT